MKKLALALVLLFAVTMAFAQAPRFEEGVLSMNGYQWMASSSEAKAGFAVGILFGVDTVRQLVAYIGNVEGFAEMLISNYGEEAVPAISDFVDNLYLWCSWDVSSEDILALLDTAYSSIKNRKFSIFEVLMLETEKAWWGDSSGT